MFLENMIDMISLFHKVNTDIYEEHGEWDVIKTTASNKSRYEISHQIIYIHTVHPGAGNVTTRIRTGMDKCFFFFKNSL